MKFTEIFDKFENHSYIRRESWSENIFVQLRNTANLIRLVMFATADTPKMKAINTLNNDIRLTVEDLLANDWIDIEDLMPKKKETPKKIVKINKNNMNDEVKNALNEAREYFNEMWNEGFVTDEMIKYQNKVEKVFELLGIEPDYA